jgi:hypothetical protein
MQNVFPTANAIYQSATEQHHFSLDACGGRKIKLDAIGGKLL